MKSEYHKDGEGIHAVALFARAWIEISNGNILAVALSSSPSLRGRGLKCCRHSLTIQEMLVALFARAWIEIKGDLSNNEEYEKSPSLRGRGLKWHSSNYRLCLIPSPSLRGRGLKC